MFLSNLWYTKKNFLIYLLVPLAIFYKAIIFLRRLLYQSGFKKISYFPVPVIIVGNITVGGTGKTPLVIWLAEQLKAAGYKPGIVSRGYGGKSKHYPCFVAQDSAATQVGDEPLLIHRKTLCPVVVDPNRVRAVQMLLNKTDCNVVISDDGLQHYALGRAVEIAVIDGERRFGNGFCLPAGPLREPVSRLKTVNFIVTNGLAKNGEYTMQLIPKDFRQIINPSNTHFINQTNIHAIAGIGNPQRFFNTLRNMGLNIIEHPFPDHHNFQPQELDFGPDAIVVMTAKDAIKCEKFANSGYWYLDVEAEISDNLLRKLLEQLKA